MNTPDRRQIQFVRLKEVQPRSLITVGHVLVKDACEEFQRDQLMPGDEEIVDITDFTSAKLTKKLKIEAGSTWSSAHSTELRGGAFQPLIESRPR
jgi:hypothetical protein